MARRKGERREMAKINEMEFAGLKSAISEGGHATAETIGARLLWPIDKLVTWLEHPYHGMSIGAAEREALGVIQSRGIRCTYQDYKRSGL